MLKLKGLSKSDIILFFGMVILFWILRIYYWQNVNEEPFSDLLDYYTIGKHIYLDWDFAHARPFWLSYKPPGFPLILSAYFWIRQSFSLDFWPFFQATILFIGLIWLCLELYLITKRSDLSVLLFLIVSVSKSSIFWSFKTATESCSEAFLYLLAASLILLQRKCKFWHFLFVGFMLMFSIFVRPQYLLASFFSLLVVSVIFISKGLKQTKFRFSVFSMFLAFFVTWLPWGIRTYNIYGKPLFTSTQGPYSFLWELGSGTIIDNNGRKITKTLSEIQSEAQREFSNDMEGMRYCQKFVNEWLKDNIWQYPKIIFNRIRSTMIDQTESLTKVSRINLYGNLMDKILLSKSEVIIGFGVLGLAGLVIQWPILWPIFTLPILLWLMGTLFLGYARMIDPSLPLISFGCFNIVLMGVKILKKQYIRFYNLHDL